MRFLLLVVAAELGALLSALMWPGPPPVTEQPAAVMRRLDVRLRADLDRPGARGDRYRLFECREVPRR